MKQVEYKEFIDEILKNTCSNHSYGEYGEFGVFDNFYVPFLSHMENEISELLKNISNSSKLKIKEQTVIKSVTSSAKDSLIEIALKTLITEFYHKKSIENLDDLTSEEIYEWYNLYLKEKDNLKEILDKYEVLNYLIYQRITAKYNLVKESLVNLYNDIDNIRKKFNKEFNIIESISLNNGDTHNGGKSVLIINFDNNEKLVYKPHGLEADEALDKIYEFINSKNMLKVDLFNVKNINKAEYGWQDFVEYEGCENKEEAVSYYYRIGAILGIFNILKTGDIHSENIIAAKDNPTLIDLETLLTNDNTEGLEDNLLLSYLMEINNSVLGCYILPQNLEYSLIDIDLSGLSGDGGKTSDKITYLVLKDTGTDNIRFEKEYVVSTENNNKPSIKGEKLNALDFAVEIESGFEDTYSLIKNHKEEFLEIIYDALSKGVYRQVLRPTYIYSRYLQASYHPKYLKKFEDREKLFNILKDCDIKTFNNNDMKNKKSIKEVESLMEDDIPYFASDFKSKTLYINNKDTMNDYFLYTLKNIMTKRINDIDEISMAKQLTYIRNSLLTTKEDIFLSTMDSNENIPISSNDIEFSLRSIGDYIYNRAIFNTQKTACTYPNLNIAGNKTLIGPISYTLYDGAGLTIFLYALAKELKDNKYLSLAEASLKGLEELNLKNEQIKMSASAFSGIGSLVYLYYNLSHLMNDNSFYEKYLKYINKLNDYEIEDHSNFDVIGGDAGLIILALNIYKDSKDEIALAVAEKYSKSLYEHLKENSALNCLSGFSHGYSGFSLALLMAGDILKNEDYYDFALELVKKEDLLYRNDIRNWLDLRNEKEKSSLNYWCHGAPGILLARSKMINHIKSEDMEIINCNVENSLEQFIENGFERSFSNSVCHGTLGNVDILTTVAQEFKNTSLTDKVKDIFKDCLTYMEEDGVKYGLYDTLGMVNFMTGLSGMGYSILRQKNSKLPSVLCLDVIGKGMIST